MDWLRIGSLSAAARNLFLCGIVVAAALSALAGCAGRSAPAAVEPRASATVPPTPDSAQILQLLQPAATLHEAAGQCAAALGAAVETTLVRIETPKEQECLPCNKLPIGSERGAPLAEIVLPLERGSWVWLTVGDLLCIYLYDGQAFKPSSVTRW